MGEADEVALYSISGLEGVGALASMSGLEGELPYLLCLG